MYFYKYFIALPQYFFMAWC